MSDNQEKIIKYNVEILGESMQVVLCKVKYEPGYKPALAGLVSRVSEVRIEIEEKTGEFNGVMPYYREPQKDNMNIALLVGHIRKRKNLLERLSRKILNKGKRDHRILKWSNELFKREVPQNVKRVLDGTIAQYNERYGFRA